VSAVKQRPPTVRQIYALAGALCERMGEDSQMRTCAEECRHCAESCWRIASMKR